MKTNPSVIVFLMILTISISCEKQDIDSLLTDGQWKLSSSISTEINETLNFHSDGSYEIKPVQINSIMPGFRSGRIYGDYYSEEQMIVFTSTNIDIDTQPFDTLSTTGIRFQVIKGQPFGSLFGDDLLDRWRSPSDTGTIIFPEGISSLDSLLNTENQNHTRTWEILKLNKDSLIVKSSESIIRYCRN